MEGHTRKHKLALSAPTSSRKKLKGTPRISLGTRKATKENLSSVTVTADDLPWKTVHNQGGFREADEGMLALEEVDGVEVLYGAGNEGKIVGFQIKQPIAMENSDSEDVEELHAAHVLPPTIRIRPFDIALLPSWAPYPLHAALLHSLHRRNFKQPTPIQKRTLEVFLKSANSRKDLEDHCGHVSEPSQRDIIGIAETGSGKTLAYGLPILHSILMSLSSASDAITITVQPPVAFQRRHLKALVLAPTRELALQVSQHLNTCLDQLLAAQLRTEAETVNTEGWDVLRHRAAPAVSVAAIVGGMSVQKQRRILSRGVDVLVATPGRLWDLCGENSSLSSQLRSLRFLVLDEADRMIETGHFQELEGIIRLTARPPPDMDTVHAGTPAMMAQVDATSTDAGMVHTRNDTLQTFVFSATMSKELQRDLRRKGESWSRSKLKETTFDDLLSKLDFRDPDPAIIDLSPVGGRVDGLQESKIECLASDKDAYLCYFLLRYPGRSLVFLSSVDGIRRLMPLLELLNFKTWSLHSGLQQKQRLKNLDRFKSTANSVLLATDVAARGLDVPAVDHVVHYQVPRSADAYVHRNGRTARAMHDGFGLVLCAPDERRVLRGVLAGLARSDNDVPELSVNLDILGKLKARVQLARKIDIAAHRVKKEMHDKNWMCETAEAMDIELASDFERDTSEATSMSCKRRSRDTRVANLKAELKQALSQPLVAHGVSTRYLTSGCRVIVDDLVEGSNHATMLGLQKMTPGSQVARKKPCVQRLR